MPEQGHRPQDATKLLWLASWMDRRDIERGNTSSTEVQDDLRRIARYVADAGRLNEYMDAERELRGRVRNFEVQLADLREAVRHQDWPRVQQILFDKQDHYNTGEGEPLPLEVEHLRDELAGMNDMAVKTRDFTAKQFEELHAMILATTGLPSSPWPGNAAARDALAKLKAERDRLKEQLEKAWSRSDELGRRVITAEHESMKMRNDLAEATGKRLGLIADLRNALAARDTVQTGYGRMPHDDEVIDMVKLVLERADDPQPVDPELFELLESTTSRAEPDLARWYEQQEG